MIVIRSILSFKLLSPNPAQEKSWDLLPHTKKAFFQMCN
jgi:hypothetical protein